MTADRVFSIIRYVIIISWKQCLCGIGILFEGWPLINGFSLFSVLTEGIKVH